MSSDFPDQDWSRASLVLQARQSGVMDKSILNALEAIPRERFVPEEYLEHVYRDVSIPLPHGQSMISAIRIAKFLNCIQLDAPTNKILEIGTGSGYSGALLSKLCKRLYTVERHRDLSVAARSVWLELEINNIVELVGNGAQGWAYQAPFNHIFVWGAFAEIPTELGDQLVEGGSLLFAKGDASQSQDIVVATKVDGVLDEQFFGKTRLPSIWLGKSSAS